MSALLEDAGYAVRNLRSSRSFTIVAVTMLALGIGANTAIFSVVHQVLLRPLPYADPDRLTIVWNEFGSSGLSRLPLSAPQLLALKAEPGLFEDAGGIWATSATLTGPEEPAQVSMGLVTPSFFSVLGVEPALGRSFDAAEEGRRASVALISDELWRSRLGADPKVLGRSIDIEGFETTIVGVMPRGFRLMFPPDGGVPPRLDLYVPPPWELWTLPAGQYFFRVVGRLVNGIGIATAAERVAAVAESLREDYSELAASRVDLELVPMHGDAVGAIRPTLLALLTGVGMVLLLACANVAGLLIARTSGRRQEVALRLCLGASRARIFSQHLVESVLLAALAGVAGWTVALLGIDALWAIRPENLARVESVHLDTTVLAFTGGIALLSGLLFGMAPVIEASRVAPAQGLTGGRGTTRRTPSQRLRKAVIVAEVAVGLVLLIGAGLMARTFSALQRVDPGFADEQRVTFKLTLSSQRFPEGVERTRLAHEVEDRLAVLSAVEAAGATSHLPFAEWPNWAGPAAPEGVPEERWEEFYVDHRSVTPGYLPAIGARLIAGRQFDRHDDAAARDVVVVDTELAERLWPGETAVGKVLHATHYLDGSFEATPSVVVGVVEGIRDRDLTAPSTGQVFVPFAQSPRWELSYVVRARDPSSLVDEIRAQIAALDADLAASEFRLLTDLVGDGMAGTRFTTLLAEIFAGVAMGLAFVGLYGVISYSVIQRSHEIGLRMALGAGPGAIFRGVVGEGLRLAVLGILLGVPAAVAAGSFLSALLFGVTATDAATFVSVALAFVLLAAAASYFPARGAVRVDPIRSLKAD